ncbi:MAG: protein kinase, partial [Anaerolineae bacterium]|nr:protein kinase [Anaerolineae bacterium]
AIRSYELRERIGAGGFGEVYRAIQPAVNREVAIKVIKPELANQPDFIRRFESEAQLVARLEHPHIVPLYDYWREPGGAYLVMRYLPYSLHDRLAQGPLSLGESVRLVEQITAALTVAHRQGVVHRDLKPANILLDEEGNAYLTDFGIAKVLGPAARATQEGMLVGSPAYLAPEQIKSDPVTPASDLYSLGLLLYEVLTGNLPFSADLSPSALLYRQLSEPLPSLLDSRPDLPPALDDVLQRATAKDPAKRYPDALSLAAAFRDAAGYVPAAPVRGEGKVERVPVQEAQRTWTPADAMVMVRNPYKGLRAFSEADADDFFGREALVEQLLAKLVEEGPFERFLAVIGPSGSGKSSVVRAGLLPALREGRLPGSENWFFAEMLPGAHPLEELEIALTRVATRTQTQIMERLRRDDRGILSAVRMILPDDTSQLLLVIDQFEEVFTLVEDPAEARHFLDSLYTAITDPRSPLRVIITLRADFYDRPLMHAEFSQLVRHRTEVVVPMTAEEIERAISIPVEQVGVSLEPGLAAAITAEVHEQPGALPMLQYALTELFDRRQDNTLTLETYHALGGVMGVLAKQAETVYQQLDESQREVVRQLFLRLVTLGEGIEDTRRRVRRSELISLGGPAMERVIDAFDRSRLLTLDQDPANREPTVEIAHEALLREWGQLRLWLDQNRDDIRMQRRLSHAAQEWLNAGRDPSYLATGTRLSLFESWAAATEVALNEQEAEYLEASIAEWRARREREARLERRARQGLTALVVGLAVFLVVALGLLIFAIGEQGKAKDQASVAQTAEANAERNAAEIQGLLWANNAQQAFDDDHLDLALPLALAANRIENPPVFARRTLAGIAYAPGLQKRFAGHTAQITSVAYSPDGRWALSGAYDNRLILWDLDSGTILREFPMQHTEAVTSVVFHPDGRRALSGSQDSTLILWDLETGMPLARFTGHAQAVYGVAFSPDGRWALSGSQDRTLIVWDVETGGIVRTLSGEHTDAIHSVAFSPDGQWALSGAWDGRVVLWDIESGLMIQRFEGHTASVYSVAFTPDGRRVLSG